MGRWASRYENLGLLGDLDMSWVWELSSVRGFGHAFSGFMNKLLRQGTIEDTDPTFGFEVGAEANAGGTHAHASVHVRASVDDKGGVRIIDGHAKAKAEARGGHDETVFAEVDTYYDVSGADFVYAYDAHAGGPRGTRSEAREGALNKLSVIAIDFENFDLPGGPVTVEKSGRIWWRSESFEGVTAEAEADAEGSGDAVETYSETDTFATDTFASAAAFSLGDIA